MSTPRRLVFGQVAELYDASRPTYPDALIDDLLQFSALRGHRALEVGAGTGKATRLIGARGVAVLAIEPSTEMAAVARRTCAAYPSVEVVESDFESWDPGRERFGLLFSGQAWHWIARRRLCPSAGRAGRRRPAGSVLEPAGVGGVDGSPAAIAGLPRGGAEHVQRRAAPS